MNQNSQLPYHSESEISLADIAKAFKKEKKSFFRAAAAFFAIGAAMVLTHHVITPVTLAQNVQVASVARPSGGQLASLIERQPIETANAVSRLYFTPLFSDISSSFKGFTASPLSFANPKDLFFTDPKTGQQTAIKSYTPNPSIIQISTLVSHRENLKNPSIRARYIDEFKQLASMLQQYQKGTTQTYLSQQKQLLKSLKNQLANAEKMNIRLHSPTSTGNNDVATVMKSDRMTSYGLDYLNLVASTQLQIKSTQMNLDTFQPAHLVGRPYILKDHSKASSLGVQLALLMLLSLLIGCFVVLFRRLSQDTEK